MEPTPHNLRKGCAGERSLPRRSMGFCLACPQCTSRRLFTCSILTATQYGRHVSDLRSTNGHVQAKANGDELFAIETYGGVISFNLEECWYLEHA